MNLQNIRWRIALPYMALIILVMSGIFLYLSNFVRQSYLDSLQNELTAEARLTASVLELQLTSGAIPSTLDALAKEWSTALDKRVTLIDRDGLVLGESHEDRLRMDNHANRPEVVQAELVGLGVATRYSDTEQYEMMYVAAAVRSQGELIGFARLSLPLRRVEDNMAHLQRAWSLVTLAATVIAVLLAIWIASRTTRPLRDLSEAAAQMGQGRLETHLIPRTNDEIGQLTQTFNIMAEQLNQQIGALQIERSRMGAVLSVMTDGVIIVDTQGDIQLLNNAVLAMFNLQEDQAVGRSLMSVLRQHQIMELWQACRQAGDSQATLIEIAPRRLVLYAIATPLGQALPGHTLLLFQNLTHMRRLETVRQDFISNISHELRTPLASLKALTETLQDGALDDPPAARRFLDRMVTEVDALTQMVEELLELSRIESGKVPLRLSSTTPASLIHSATQRLAMQSERAGVDVSIDAPEDLPAVLADAPRLVQVLVNLLHNAIKFTPAGGSIHLWAETRPEEVVFAVRDTGAGIAAGDLPRIFERFYKADRARTGGGTGLGLAIARHQVEAHGGQIWVDSAEGHGSTFYFSIPIAKP